MSTRWALKPDEFRYFWQSTGQDRLPPGLAIWSDCTEESELNRVYRGITDRLDSDPDLNPGRALAILAEPEARITIVGTYADTPIRLVAAAVESTAVVAVQKPGRAPDRGGEVHLRLIQRADLGGCVVSVLPKAPAGKRRQTVVSAPEYENFRPSPYEWQNEDTPAGVIHSLVHSRHDSQGAIGIETRLDTAAPIRRELSWMDVTDDGRYAITSGEDIRLTPLSAEKLAAHLDKRTREQ